MQSKAPIGKVPRDVEHELSHVHIEKTWTLLQEKFCFNLKAWREDYKAYREKQDSRVSEQQAFVEFGASYINPVLNMILKRKTYHNTWGNILTYVVKGPNR